MTKPDTADVPQHANEAADAIIERLPYPDEPLTPADLAKLRAKLAMIVDEAAPVMAAGLMGTRKLTREQVQLFKILLDKITPSVTASMVEHRHTSKLAELSQEDLIRIARGE